MNREPVSSLHCSSFCSRQNGPKLAVTEDLPITKPYAEQLWAELWDARYSPIEPSLRMFEGVTARWCLFLGSLAPAEWFRKFTNRSGAR
jgi:hypothetical protein